MFDDILKLYDLAGISSPDAQSQPEPVSDFCPVCGAYWVCECTKLQDQTERMTLMDKMPDAVIHPRYQQVMKVTPDHWPVGGPVFSKDALIYVKDGEPQPQP